jgi:DNA-binding response OmpR family regulator
MAATVLLVEDERKLRELVRSYLERAGFTAMSTGSGAEAISAAASAEPDLVILDLGLPDVSGETVARELRATGSVPILMLTAKAAEEDRIVGLELGADDYVTSLSARGNWCCASRRYCAAAVPWRRRASPATAAAR